VVQFHPDGIAAVSFPPTICDFGANCSPLQGQAFFAAKRSGAAKNTACYVLVNINLSSPKRKERFRGKRGLTTGGKQTTHSPVGWRKVRLLRNLLYINNISQIAPNDSHLYTWGGTKGKRAVDDGEMTDCLTERPIGQVTNQTVSHCNVGVADQPTKRITFCSDSLFIVRLFPWLVIR